MHLKQPGFTYSACGPFTKNKERIEKFMQTGNTSFIYKSKLNKACLEQYMAYRKSKYLVKRTQSDKALRDKAFKIASDPKYDSDDDYVGGEIACPIDIRLNYLKTLNHWLKPKYFKKVSKVTSFSLRLLIQPST